MRILSENSRAVHLQTVYFFEGLYLSIHVARKTIFAESVLTIIGEDDFVVLVEGTQANCAFFSDYYFVEGFYCKCSCFRLC